MEREESRRRIEDAFHGVAIENAGPYAWITFAIVVLIASLSFVVLVLPFSMTFKVPSRVVEPTSIVAHCGLADERRSAFRSDSGMCSRILEAYSKRALDYHLILARIPSTLAKHSVNRPIRIACPLDDAAMDQSHTGFIRGITQAPRNDGSTAYTHLLLVELDRNSLGSCRLGADRDLSVSVSLPPRRLIWWISGTDENT